MRWPSSCATRADADAPPEGYNHVLALAAMREGDTEEAARRLEREGLSHASGAADLEHAMDLYLELGRWDYVRSRLADPKVAKAVDAHTQYRMAVHDRNWKRAAVYHLLMLKPRWQMGPLLMSLVTALCWGVFCARLGHLGQRPKLRVPLYLAAFVLGVLSIAPTLTLISIEEAALQLKQTGDPLRDLLFFIFGVGFREEASKLLLFLPLVPILRRYGDRLDVAVCGALVGLGFAAEENVGYLTSGALSTGLSRFLTANFFHMALTGTLALAPMDFFADTEKHSHTLSKTALMVIGMHGLYDFLLTHGEYGGSYLAMTIFVLLTRMYLTAAQDVRRGAGRGLSLTHTFVLATAVVTGATYVYAASSVGYGLGLAVLAQGLLGIAIMVFVFLRTLRGV
jgi:RsiW-degrading membrane proteinase PrsW (M82 family)